MHSKRFMIFGTSLGSALEYYDFVLFMMFSPYIGETFFPASTPFVATLQTLSLFAVGYFARPLGGIIFGHIGDKHGRKSGFTYSIMLMALTTLCIAILPGYDRIGTLGAVALCLLRVLQGIAQGAELPGALTFISEHSPSNMRGWRCALVTMGVGFGASFSALVSYLLTTHLSHAQMLAFGWRLPFYLGGLIAIIGYFIRKMTQETPDFLQQPNKAKVPIVELLTEYPRQIGQGIAITLFAACFIIFALYLPTYLNTYFGYPSSQVMLAFTVCTTLTSLLIPVFGALSDRLGRARVLSSVALLILCSLFLLFNLLRLGSTPVLFLFMFTYQVLISIMAACYPAMLAELFPTKVRYSGIAFCYNTSFSLASMVPLLASALLHSTQWPYSVVVIFMLLAGLTMGVTRTIQPEVSR